MRGHIWGAILISLSGHFPISSFAAIPEAQSPYTVEKEGHQYQIVPDVSLHTIRVYSDDLTPVPGRSLTVRVKKQNGVWEKIHLTLSETTPDRMVYKGLIPSRVQIAGAVKFDIDFTKHRKGNR